MGWRFSLLSPHTAMDVLAVYGIECPPMKDFDQIVDYRAEKREHLRGRNNVTSCRSPTREFEPIRIKSELKEKRHLEFQRRRSVSPEPSANLISKKKPKRKTLSMKYYSPNSKSETLHTNVQKTPTSDGRPLMVFTPNSSLTDSPSTSKWAYLWPEEVTLTRRERDHAKQAASTSTPAAKESNLHRTKGMDKNMNSVNAQKKSIKTFTQTGKTQQKLSNVNENILQKVSLRDNSVQTESGLVTVRETDIQLLADLLQEALWREEALKKKLAALQESTTNLMNSSSKIWTACCREDLLRNKIKALEAQLQVCMQNYPKDGVKKVVIQMEKQRWVYEEKALEAFQKATEEKTEALSKAETLQEALSTAKTESMRWQSLYEDLKLSFEQDRENQRLNNEQLGQLHSQLELSKAREAELRKEVVSLRRENKELQYNISLLEEDNQVFREEMQHLTEGRDETQDFFMQEHLTLEEAKPQVTERRESQVEEQLRHTQEKLRLKEKECEELQTELCVMEQECQSSQARLSQCRDELRQLTHRSRPTPCGSWWKVWVFFLLFLAVTQVAMLWMWYPPFREQVEDLYSDIETRIEDYLMKMASPQHSGCFRPI
ncbi:TRAF3-interacting JNK-activating modulator [Xyrichtys novacula]|uniref:TRAF3-interacting JNK-activating modulator n=1 Tax=Xyrichtys novacula TaxID=13765 RepID=A0AAV1HM28_XYRNO|nr:TRAF3-interacting JNK-activating modulator [Xyrichtys novacula]